MNHSENENGLSRKCLMQVLLWSSIRPAPLRVCNFTQICCVISFLGIFQDSSWASESSQRFCTVDAQFSLLLRISHHYGKLGAQILLSMGALQNLSSCNLMGGQKKVPLAPKYNYIWFMNSHLQFCILLGQSKGSLQNHKWTDWWNWQEEVTYYTCTANSHLFYIACGLGWFSWGSLILNIQIFCLTYVCRASAKHYWFIS